LDQCIHSHPEVGPEIPVDAFPILQVKAQRAEVQILINAAIAIVSPGDPHASAEIPAREESLVFLLGFIKIYFLLTRSTQAAKDE
jgi:hypothetical protein